MERINKTHWFVGDNKIGISLMRYAVDIEILKNDSDIFYRLNVYDDGKVALVFNFYSLADAIRFTEEDIDKSDSLNKIVESYKTKFANNEFIDMNSSVNLEVEDNKIVLTPDQVKQAIWNLFCKGKDYDMSVEYELRFNNSQLDISFYIIEHLDFGGLKKDNRIRLTEGDLNYAFSNYLKNSNYDLEEFKYIGGIHRVGYYFDDDTSHFDGIELKVKEKDKNNVLKLKK